LPHELRGMDRLPHESFTFVLYLIGASAVAIALVVVYLTWRHGRKRSKQSGASLRQPRGSSKRKRRR
jgi:hypothetical protein